MKKWDVIGKHRITISRLSFRSWFQELLQPLVLECLAHPCGITLSSNEDAIYVSETLNNRILRFVQKLAGVYHCSEFFKVSGRFGPTALAIDGDGIILISKVVVHCIQYSEVI